MPHLAIQIQQRLEAEEQTKAQAEANAQRQAQAEYDLLIARASTPLAGDADRMVELLPVVGKSLDDVRADSRAFEAAKVPESTDLAEQSRRQQLAEHLPRGTVIGPAEAIPGYRHFSLPPLPPPVNVDRPSVNRQDNYKRVPA
jgi:hypothetical protein